MSAFGAETDATTVVKALGAEASGKIFVITGPSEGGIGAECATTLAAESKPARLILVGRSAPKVQPVIATLAALQPDLPVTFVTCDLTSASSTRAAATAIGSVCDRVDVLINNAGVMAIPTLQRAEDGTEMHFAANHLGHFLLTRALIPRLVGRVINVTSLAYELAEVDFEDVNFQKRPYAPWVAYGQSKAANVQHAFALGSRYASKGLTAFAVHPGYAPSTRLQANTGVDMDLFMEGYKLSIERNGGKQVPPPTERSIPQAAATILSAALDPELQAHSPALMVEHAVAQGKPYATNPADCDKLWALSEQLVGLSNA